MQGRIIWFFLKRIGFAFFSNRRAIRGAWHPAPIAAIPHRSNPSSAFLLSFQPFLSLNDLKDLNDINDFALVGVFTNKRFIVALVGVFTNKRFM